MQSKLSGINTLALSIFEINKEKGFWDKERNIGEMLMLVSSELGEAMEAHRKGKFANWDNFDKDKLENNEKLAFQNNIKDSFEDEIADAIIRLLDMSAGLGINLEKQIEAKINYNKTREKLHGKKY